MADHFLLLLKILCNHFSPPSTPPISVVFQSRQDNVMEVVILRVLVFSISKLCVSKSGMAGPKVELAEYLDMFRAWCSSGVW